MRARIQKISKYAPSIFQGSIAFSSSRRSFSLTAEHPAEAMARRALLGTLALLACAYVYFVGASILNVVERKEALTDSADLATAISHLERDYFALSGDLGPEDGARLGLKPVSNTMYVHRPGNAAIADLESNEI
jgi:hypothetical protein